VFGSPDAIARLQRSSAHWYQRPDAEHVTVDPSRTRLTGWSAGFGLSKIGGEAWFWNVEASASSPGFEIRDAGGQTRADRVDSALGFRYLRRDPTGRLRDWTGGASISGSWNFGRVRRQTSGSAFFTGTWSNLWNTYVEVGVNDRALSDDLTRGGPLAGSPYSGTGSVRLSSPSSNRLLWSLEGSGYLDEFGGRSVTGSAGLTAFAGARVEVGVLAGRSVSVDARYPLAVLDGGPATTFGKRYVFASLERHETYGRLHVKVAFAPDAVLTGHIEPFASSGLVSDPGRLVAARGRRLLTYGTGGTAVEREQDGAWLIWEDGETSRVESNDFRVRSFRGTGVFRWEWRRGSTLFLIWQRSLWRSLDRAGPAGPTELFETLQDPGQDVFAVKLSVLLGG
jgi:hypothetical protein